MEIENKHLVIVFIILACLTFYTLYEINEFMPIVESCADDFAVIDKCKCLPGDYHRIFPNAPPSILVNE